MLKITVLILTLYACGIKANSIYRNEWHVPQEQPVNQHAYYSQYGPLFKELADYQQKVYQQGLAAVAYDQNPPFTLHHEYNQHPVAAEKPVNQGEYPLHNYYSVSETINKKNEKEIVAKKPEKHTDKHNADGVVVVVANNKKQQPGHLDNKHESNAISRLNETIHKIGDNIEDKFLAIKNYVENSVKVFNQAGDDMYQRIGNKTTSAFDKIHKNLEGIESQLHQLKPNNQQHEHSAAVAFSKPTMKPFYTSRYNFDRETPAANVVHSEQNKHHSLEQNNNYRSIDNIDLDAEMRTDIKSSITNAVQNAQDKLNKMIDDQVAKVNKKVNEFNQRLDAALLRFNEALSSIKTYQPKPTTETLYVTPTTTTTKTTTSTTPKYTKTTFKYDTLPTIKYTTTTTTPKPTTVNYYNRPTTKYITTSTPKYTINWTPKALTWKPTPKTVNFFDQFTTPEYYKYTVSTPKFLRTDTDDVELAESLGDTVKSNINRMDTVESLDKEEEQEMKAKDNEGLDDLAKSEILENVDDKLKSGQVDADVVQEIIESDSSISIEDKLKIVEEDASEMEMALENELRNELKETIEDKLIVDADKDADTEKSLVDNVELQKMNSDEINVNNDDLAKSSNEENVNEDESEPMENVDDSMKNIETDINDGNDNIDGNDDEIRTLLTDDANIIDDIEEVTMENVDEESSIETNRFDELEVIQLIPVIIEQLRKGNVVEEEKVALQKIFGDLWELIVIEANRVNSLEEMNPLLKTLLQSEEVRLAKREIKKQIGNDIYKNSIRRIYRGDSKSNNNVPKPYIALDDDRKLLSPSERLLNMVAAIVHKTNVLEMAKSKKRRNFRQKKKQANKKHPLGIVTVQKPRQKYLNRILNINRMKRSLIKFGVDMHDMKVLMDQVNSQENGDDDDDYYQDNNEKRHDESDYQNTDYYEDDYNYQEQEQERVEEIPTDDSYEDYSIDNFNMAYRRNNDGDDYENGSVVELINLAKQRDRREKIQHKADAEYEDEYDEVPEENEYGIDASSHIEY